MKNPDFLQQINHPEDKWSLLMDDLSDKKPIKSKKIKKKTLFLGAKLIYAFKHTQNLPFLRVPILNSCILGH